VRATNAYRPNPDRPGKDSRRDRGAFHSKAATHAFSIKTKSNLDDTLDGFPCHGVGGIVGMLLTGVLAGDAGLVRGETRTFLFHLLALAIVSVFSFFGSLALFRLTDWILPIRVTPEQEAVGLDLSQHGEFMELEPTRQFRYSE
jgi:ammonium transporter, Amt family